MGETIVAELMTSGKDPREHVVATPHRATEKYLGDSLLRGAGAVLNILACGLFGLLCLAIAGDSEGWRIAGFVFLGLGGLTFMANQQHMGNGLKMASDGLGAPKRRTAQETLTTFLSCLYDYGASRMWKRAYNCLTDTAQSVQDLDMPRDSYVREKLKDPKITTVEEFQAWWEESAVALGYHFAPARERIRVVEESEDLAVLSVAIKLTWNQEQGLKEADTEWVVPLVKRGDFWFMTAGYFWPDSVETEGSDSAEPTTAEEGGTQ